MNHWPDAPCRLGELLEYAAECFEASGLYFGHGTDNAWDEVVLLTLYGLELPWSSDASILERLLKEAERDRLVALFQRRLTERVPTAYLTGRAVFAGLEFRVTDDVLVPRSPVGELIERGYAPWLRREPARVLDLCCGCGCIGIATALALPAARVDLSDVSRAAVAVAEHNVLAHGLQDRVDAITGDLFAPLAGERYDLIVCNPPYVDDRELASMPAEYRAEPEIGLAAGSDGLALCRRILAEARDYLADDGALIVEVGNSWEALERSYPGLPFTWIDFERGGHGVFLLEAGELDQL